MSFGDEPHGFADLGYSRSRIDASGDTLRRWAETQRDTWTESELDALRVALAYRAAHGRALTTFFMGLRSMVKTAGAPVVVAQRLKRMPAIVGKLARFPRMDLSRMQDIGGCRAILPDHSFVDRVGRRIARNGWVIDKEYDYTSTPKTTGYRALHLVVLRHGRLIEVQIRTEAQHVWAEGVERIEARRQYGLKDGNGPNEVMELLQMSAYAMDQVSRGEMMSDEFNREFERLALRARPLL